MAYNDRAILVDANGQPIPQLFNPTANAYQPLQGTVAGGPRTTLYSASGAEMFSVPRTGVNGLAPTAAPDVNAVSLLSNGVTLDLQHGNIGGTLLASAARTAAVNSADQINRNGRNLHVIVNVTAFTSGSLTVTVQGVDPAVAGGYYNILVGSAIAATGRTIFKVGPGIAPLAGASAQDMLPRDWRVAVAVGSAVSITYSISYQLGV